MAEQAAVRHGAGVGLFLAAALTVGADSLVLRNGRTLELAISSAVTMVTKAGASVCLCSYLDTVLTGVDRRESRLASRDCRDWPAAEAGRAASRAQETSAEETGRRVMSSGSNSGAR